MTTHSTNGATVHGIALVSKLLGSRMVHLCDTALAPEHDFTSFAADQGYVPRIILRAYSDPADNYSASLVHDILYLEDVDDYKEIESLLKEFVDMQPCECCFAASYGGSAWYRLSGWTWHPAIYMTKQPKRLPIIFDDTNIF